MRRFNADYGLRCHRVIQEMCKLFGIKDLGAKVSGSTTSFNVAKAFLLALRRQKSPEQVALDSGMKVHDVRKIYQTGYLQYKRYSLS
jgi:ribosomal protein S5